MRKWGSERREGLGSCPPCVFREEEQGKAVMYYVWRGRGAAFSARGTRERDSCRQQKSSLFAPNIYVESLITGSEGPISKGLTSRAYSFIPSSYYSSGQRMGSSEIVIERGYPARLVPINTHIKPISLTCNGPILEGDGPCGIDRGVLPTPLLLYTVGVCAA